MSLMPTQDNDVRDYATGSNDKTIHGAWSLGMHEDILWRSHSIRVSGMHRALRYLGLYGEHPDQTHIRASGRVDEPVGHSLEPITPNG